MRAAISLPSTEEKLGGIMGAICSRRAGIGRRLTANARAQRDPTRSTLLRKQYVSEIRKRYTRVGTAVRDLVVNQDALGLAGGRRAGLFAESPLGGDGDTLTAFDTWLMGIMAAEFDGDWQERYVRAAYMRGLALANGYAVAAGVPAFDSPDYLLTLPPYNSRYLLHLSQQRANLKQNTENARNKMVVALGAILLMPQIGSMEANRWLQNELKKYGRIRGEALARTGVVSVLNDAILDRLEAVGFKNVTPAVEFTTVGDERVCPTCAALDGRVYSIKEARGVIPVHISCRCSWLPFIK
ncbi:MAG: hypothetical protein D6706_02550 [Chloroflexi bacterium]|nr:MAG: hypothetical protein D6706_02550 [Chloroflexota bacterium]